MATLSRRDRQRLAQLRKMAGEPTLREATDAAINAWVRAPALPGVRTPVTQARGRTARMRALEEWLGGEKAAAAAAGVTPRTWRGWDKGTRPTARSLAGLQGAYEEQLDVQAQAPARRRAQARRLADDADLAVGVKAFAEVQWEGYYNGQVTTSPKDIPYAPDPENEDAYRSNGCDFGPVPFPAVLRAWADGRNTGLALEDAISEAFSGPPGKRILLNAYRRGVRITLG